MIFEIKEEDFQLIMKAIVEKCGPEYELDEWNEYNKLKTILLFQYGMSK